MYVRKNIFLYEFCFRRSCGVIGAWRTLTSVRGRPEQSDIWILFTSVEKCVSSVIITSYLICLLSRCKWVCMSVYLSFKPVLFLFYRVNAVWCMSVWKLASEAWLPISILCSNAWQEQACSHSIDYVQLIFTAFSNSCRYGYVLICFLLSCVFEFNLRNYIYNKCRKCGWWRGALFNLN